MQNGYKIAARYCIIKINEKYCLQKQGVILRNSWASCLAISILQINTIEMGIREYNQIKLTIRQFDVKLQIGGFKNIKKIIQIVLCFSPKILKLAHDAMNNDPCKFLDTSLFKIKNKVE